MSVVQANTATIGNVVKWLAFANEDFHFEWVTLNIATAGTYAQGTVLAKVTATGKYLVQDASLASGAGLEASAILIGTDVLNPGVTVAAATDTKALVLKRGPAKVAKGQLIMGAGTDTDAEKQAVYDALEALGILMSTQI